jgi:hypothetical protein
MAKSTVAPGSRFRVARTRGALSGVVLVVLGAWAALVPFIGPYFDFAYTPSADQAWMWTAERGYMEVAPGAAAFVGGLILLFSTSRVMAMFGAWLGVAGGAWLILGPPLAGYLNVDLGQPDPASNLRVQTLESLFFFYAIGAAILFVASFALGRISTHSVRDVRAAERRAAALTAREDRVEPAPTTAPETFPWAERAEPAADEHERGPDAGAYEHGRLAEPGEPASAPGQVATERAAPPESPVRRHENDVPEPSGR